MKKKKIQTNKTVHKMNKLMIVDQIMETSPNKKRKISINQWCDSTQQSTDKLMNETNHVKYP